MATVTSHGTRIYYETYGEGSPAIVFAHGMGGNAAIWYNQVAEFSQRHKVITFAHRYFARSDCPPEAFDPAKGEAAIAQATREADTAGIQGPASTPWLPS